MTSPAATRPTECISIDEMLSGVKWLKEIDTLPLDEEKKVEAVVKAIECPREYLELFEELMCLMEHLLRKHMNSHEIKVASFGSIVMNLALSSCDLDLYIELGSKYLPDEYTMRMLRKILFRRDFSGIFKSVYLVYAKVPIIKCEHVIGFSCDISINNEIARRNSQLIAFYLSLNERFRNFFLLLKLWMKRMGLVGSALFKSYTVYLLALYYLQTQSLVPSVHYLQNHPQSPPPQYIDSWNASFLNDKALFQDIGEKKLNVFDLLSGFFKFYSKFEFSFYTISPYMGKAYLKPFKNSLAIFGLNEESASNFRDKAYISVQDVFIFNFNTAGNVSKRDVIDFQEYCTKAANICQSPNRSVIFEKLFWVNSQQTGKRKKRQTKATEFRPGKCCLSGDSEEEIRQNWIMAILDKVENVLKNISLAEIVRQDEGVYECQTFYQAHFKTLRKEVFHIIEAECAAKGEKMQFKGLGLQQEISRRIKDLPEDRKLEKPLSFAVHYSSTAAPTRIEYSVSVSEKNASDIARMFSLKTSLVTWLAEI